MIGFVASLYLIAVDIKGEVQNPGVYRLESGTISYVIELAGGLTNYGDTQFINLARALTDEMVIYIPDKRNRNQNDVSCNCPPVSCPPVRPTTTTATTTMPQTTTTITTTTRPTTRTTTTTTPPEDIIININTATKEELMKLRGVGEVIANRIIAFREATPFVTIEDIMEVSGIGEVIFAQIKDFITV